MAARVANFGSLEKGLCASFSWERAQKKRDLHKLFGGDFQVEQGVPNGPFSATRSLPLDRKLLHYITLFFRINCA